LPFNKKGKKAMPKKILILMVCLWIAPVSAALAQGGLYIGLHGGGSFLEGAENEGDSGTFNLEFDPGYLAGVTVGYDLRDNYPKIGKGRVEIEFAYRSNDLDQVEFADSDMDAGGEATVFSVMLNTFGEYRETTPWIPYVGAGIGWARISLKDVDISRGPLVDDEDNRFAFQFGAGLGYELSPHFALDLGYRYFAVLEPEFRDAQGEEFESEYRTHQIHLGVRVTF
jgi:opacity protein-like surface antigen